MFIREEVWKDDKSNEINEVHEENIEIIFWTKEVFIFSKFIEVNDEHPENIFCIFVTWEVSKLDKSISTIFFKFKNIFLQDVILCSIHFIFIIFSSDSKFTIHNPSPIIFPFKYISSGHL